MVLTIYVTTLSLSTHLFPYTFSYTYLIHDLSSLFCLKCTLYSVHPSIYLEFLFAFNGPTNQNNQLRLGGSKLHSKLWFFICIISCFVVEYKYEIWNITLPLIFENLNGTLPIPKYNVLAETPVFMWWNWILSLVL